MDAGPVVVLCLIFTYLGAGGTAQDFMGLTDNVGSATKIAT